MSERHLDYIQNEERKRNLRSLGITLLIYLILSGALWGWSSLFRHELEMNQGPILIRLGVNEGAEISTPAKPDTRTETEPAAEPEKPQETPRDEPADSVPAETPRPADAAQPRETTPAKPLPAAKPANEAQSVPSPVKETAPALPKPIKGSEAGNNYELNSDGGDIGRSLWVPIYLYMPLPREIPAVIDGQGGLNSLLDHVIGDETGIYTADENKTLLMRYYEKKQKTLVLKKPVTLDNRPELWSILERAGYDMTQADYKTDRTLLPVTIYFEVEPSGSSQANKLTGLELIKSSGHSGVDEAVMYAFQQSSYYNGADKAIKGRFTYRFY